MGGNSFALGALAAAALGHSGAAFALAAQPGAALLETAAPQPSTATDRTTYDAVYFAQFSPSTALQIVQRIPGFSIQDTAGDVRGFAGTAGNVVINGQRPSTKSDSLETILSRIPANRVLRVEVGSGDAFGADYTGKPQVANLVLTEAGGVAGTITAGVSRDFYGRYYPSGSVSALVKRGKSSFNVSGTIRQFRTSDEGPDTLIQPATGAMLERRQRYNRYRQPDAAAAAAWDYNGGPNRTAHLNMRYAANRLRLDQQNLVVPTSGANRDDALTQRYNQDDLEFGGDVTQPFAGGGLKLVALATRRDRHLNDRSLQRSLGHNVLGGFAQTLVDSASETLGRVVWNRPDLAGWATEVGGEAVINVLDSHVDLYALGAGGVATPILLPVRDARVRERRGEAFVNAGRPLGGGVRLDLGLAYERSNLTVSGDAAAQRTLQFWKPKATLDWHSEGSKLHAQLTLQRTVAQLQFTDFISSAELSNNRVNGSNPDLVPQRAWESLLTLERPIMGDGLAKIELGYQRIALVQDRVPTANGFDAPGNLGDGTILIAKPSLDLPLAGLGVKGGRLSLLASYIRSRVEDPYTHQQRRFSGNTDLYLEADFRQDLGKFAWGVSASGGSHYAFYRLDEVDAFANAVPYVTAFAEYRPDAKTSVTLTVNNLLDKAVSRKRSYYTPSRFTPSPYLLETRVRYQHVVPQLTVKRSFG